MPLKRKNKKVAVVCARGLGDALLSMTLAHNLTLSGAQVTTFSSILTELKNWFPGYAILPFPSKESLSKFDTVIAADHSMVCERDHFGNELLVLKEEIFDKKLPMSENLRLICKEKLALPHAENNIGIVVPNTCTWRKFSKRIVLHPMSSDPKKNWPSEKFVALARHLEQLGFDPYFCVSPDERQEWEARVPEKKLPFFSDLEALARFVVESGAMIGNDSGVGHLASALCIPTLTLFARKSYAHLWRPGWGLGRVVTPAALLPGSRFKQKYWKQQLSVKRALKAFEKLGAER